MIRGVPYDAEVEYLESTGTQYIDTGVAINCRTDTIDCRVKVTSVKNYGTAFAVYESIDGGGKNFGVRRNGTQASWQALWGSLPQTLVLDTVYDIHYGYGANACYINDITGSSSVTTEFTKPLYIFAFNNLNGANLFNAQCLYSFSISRNGVLVRDFIPVRFTNENNETEGAMYDRVTRKLFRNAGTGAFVIGPDVATPVMGLHFMRDMGGGNMTAKDYIQDGLIAMWDGIENAGWGVHDPNATTWKDLSGNEHNLNIPSSIAFGTNYGMASGKAGAVIRRLSSVYDAIVASGGYTIEVVFESSGVNGAIATIGNENGIASFNTSRASFRASDKYNGSGTNLTLQYSIATTSVAKKSWVMTVELGVRTILYENATVNRSVSSGGIAGLQYPQYVGIGLNSSYPNSNDGAGGKYYSVRLYSRALTADEIAHNYAIDKARFNLT